MDQFTGLRNYLETDRLESLLMGRFTIRCNACLLMKLTVEQIDEKFKFHIITADADDYDASDPYYTHSYTSDHDLTDLDPVILEFNTEYMKVLDHLHSKLIACRHCGEIFGLNDIHHEQYGFTEQCLCNDCGLQNIYDSKYSEDRCCICLDAIGFGEFVAICGDPKHKIHIGCGKQQQICPLCRRGNPNVMIAEIVDDQSDDGLN